MEIASAIRSTAGPVVPTGKKRLASESRHAARSRQSVVIVVSTQIPSFVIYFTRVSAAPNARRWGVSGVKCTSRIRPCKPFSSCR